MEALNLGSIQIPINAATKTFAILAKRGAGKSYTGAVLAEEFSKAGIPFVVFDPIDVWWGLRLDKNGKDKGLPVVVFGKEHADIDLQKDMGQHIAQAIVQGNLSCIISTFGMPKNQQRALVADFAEEILNINNTPRHIFIEEAHEFIPQRVFGAMGTVFNAVSNLIVMGRNRGLGVTLINQRAATINKDVLTQIDTLLAFRNVAPQDRKALQEWVEHHAADGDFEAFMQSLPSLPTGEGWIWSPEFMGLFKRIKIRARETFHPDREKLGETWVMPSLERPDVQQFIKRFKHGQPNPKKEAQASVKANGAAPALSIDVLGMKNDYESQLREKDNEIRELSIKLSAIAKILGTADDTSLSTPPTVGGGQVDMWVEKLGAGGAARILKFLADKAGMKFSRSQVALAVGMASKGGSFRTYIATLKRNSLIVEAGNLLFVNPDLLN